MDSSSAFPLTARVCGAHLPEHVGETVRLVGKHAGYTAINLVITAADGQQVRIQNASRDAFDAAQYVEVLGKVMPDFSIQAYAVTAFGNSFGMCFDLIFQC